MKGLRHTEAAIGTFGNQSAKPERGSKAQSAGVADSPVSRWSVNQPLLIGAAWTVLSFFHAGLAANTELAQVCRSGGSPTPLTVPRRSARAAAVMLARAALR